ncbi:hypothetical protein KZX46_08430 [Polymorphobacter sp. PAMC 29334]|uniref:hypothetical protein n=1 Tax=Polymorphobacter sp. PAMC 29334 TaxID=2862331 RepID=UPI001C744FA7|nr:hypothetical protein [Polymorphobacter sp. PAMC 29334]QYE35952.1 hypothetical protein KZX46_08430 [Polymorphobacter sp. PAMC 29334]
MAEIAITYIARGAHGIETVEKFIAAYSLYPARCSHDLIFLMKNWQADQRDEVEQLAASCGASTIDVPETGFDWSAYFQAARMLSHKNLCLLNSHARPQVDGWLALLAAALASPDVVMAGATGSWETPRWSPLPGASRLARARHHLARIQLTRFLTRFPKFPNPHLRSNGVLVSRSAFSRFGAIRCEPRTKEQALILESGRSGLSRHLCARGGQLVVAGADGQIFSPTQWPHSNTFRTNNQNNLIIADNRTDQFLTSEPGFRQLLTQLAWGSQSNTALVSR